MEKENIHHYKIEFFPNYDIEKAYSKKDAMRIIKKALKFTDVDEIIITKMEKTKEKIGQIKSNILETF